GINITTTVPSSPLPGPEAILRLQSSSSTSLDADPLPPLPVGSPPRASTDRLDTVRKRRSAPVMVGVPNRTRGSGSSESITSDAPPPPHAENPGSPGRPSPRRFRPRAPLLPEHGGVLGADGGWREDGGVAAAGADGAGPLPPSQPGRAPQDEGREVTGVTATGEASDTVRLRRSRSMSNDQ
ncbi:hypothetical protein HK405_001727, partial [Cladochytrium tenue]